MGLGEGSNPLYVCLYVPEFPAQALLRLRPEQANTPVVVLKGEPPLQEVCSINTHALRLGVAHGMTRAELTPFEGITLLRRSEPEERSARMALLEAVGQLTPRAEIQSATGSSAFILVLDMTGTRRIFGPVPQIISRVAHMANALHFFVQLAASENLHAAVCLAPSARKAPRMVPAGHEAEHLQQLTLAALSLNPQQADALSLWGLHTFGDLARIPEEELVIRLGQPGKRLRLLARGECPHLMVPEEPVFALEEFLAFDAPIEILDSLLFILGPMLDQLIARAGSRALALASVTVKLGLEQSSELEGSAEHERTVRPALPVDQRDVLLKLLHLDLQAHPPAAGVVYLRVIAEPGARSKVQTGLFSPQMPEPMRLDVTLARIAALVGEERVGRAALLDTHTPDGFRMERFVVPDATRAKTKERAAKLKATLRRCRPPLRITLQREGDRPAAFSLQGKRYVVQQAYGPWRKSGAWWSAELWSHEEWDVHATCAPDTKLNCVLSHDLLHKHWQLEGMYD